MYYQVSRRKSLAFKILYLVFSALVEIYAVYIFFENLLNGVHNGLTFDDIILLISTLCAILFEGAIMGFIVRSFKLPTILMKNLVFKNDGTPYVTGIVLVSIGIAVAMTMTAVFFVSAYITPFLNISLRSQWFVIGVGLILGINLIFTLIYFFTFRHESGSFAII